MATNNTNRVTQFGQLLQLVSGAADFARNVPHRWYSFDWGTPFGERGDFTHDLFDWFCFFRRGRCLRYRFLLNGFCNNSKGPGNAFTLPVLHHNALALQRAKNRDHSAGIAIDDRGQRNCRHNPLLAQLLSDDIRINGFRLLTFQTRGRMNRCLWR
ncbi:hypothetical protein ENINMM079B_25170 [Enterobacter intestinihominis]